MPIGVSGPGALSQRTDMSQPVRVPTGLPYGQAGALAQQEQASAVAQDPSVPASAAATAPAQSPVQAMGAQPPADLNTPSQRPGEPVTHGADSGPGADSSILTARPGLPAGGGQISQAISLAAASDPSGVLAQLLVAAQQRGL